MKNREYVIQNHVDRLLNIVHEYGACEVCNVIGCAQYCKSAKAPITCKLTFETWLNMEHTEPLPFPIGTVVEVTKEDSVWLGYYNGIHNSTVHSVCIYKENIGKKIGSIPEGTACTIDQIKKVGD